LITPKRGLIIFSKKWSMMFTNTKSLKIIFLLLLLQIPFAYAEQKPVAQLKSFLATTKTLTANFKQVLYDETGKVKQISNGVFNLSRPGKFRWDYQKPFQQEIVSNSGKVWFYDADLEQVTIKKLDKSMGSTPALLLTGDVDIEKEFNIEKQGNDEGMQWIKLLPKNEESSFKYVLIGLNEGTLGGMELSDNFGQLTRIYFSDVTINPQIKADEFNFVIPKGVDVLEDKEQQDKKPDSEQMKEQNKEPIEVKADEQKDDTQPEIRHLAPVKHTHTEKTSDAHKKSLTSKETQKEKSKEKSSKSKDTSKDKHSDKSKSSDKEKSSKSKEKDKSKDKKQDKHKDKSSDKEKSKSKTKDKHK
jgi:outer membrane lipoprotein carrier protein